MIVSYFTILGYLPMRLYYNVCCDRIPSSAATVLRRLLRPYSVVCRCCVCRCCVYPLRSSAPYATRAMCFTSLYSLSCRRVAVCSILSVNRQRATGATTRTVRVSSSARPPCSSATGSGSTVQKALRSGLLLSSEATTTPPRSADLPHPTTPYLAMALTR